MAVEGVGAEPDVLSSAGVNGLEVFGQAIANIAPSASIAGTPVLIAFNAGDGAWVSMLIATMVTILVAACIVTFARRVSTSGSLYTFVARSLGPAPAFVTGVCLVAGYLMFAVALSLGVTIYLDVFLSDAGVTSGGTAIHVALIAGVSLVGALLALRGLRLATRVGLVLEVISIFGIVVLFAVILAKHGMHIDSSQFRFESFSWNGVFLGVAIGFASFVGFESAASLGAEAGDPVRQIPRSIFLSVMIGGLLFVIGAYTTVLGFGGSANLVASGAPLSDLSKRAGVSWLRYVIDLGVAASFMAGYVACLNAAARQLFTFGKERIVAAGVAHVSRRYGTPTAALLIITPVTVIIPVGLLAYGTHLLKSAAYSVTVGSFFFLLAYALVAAGSSVFAARRTGHADPPRVVASVVAVLAIGFVFYKYVVPVPRAPYNVLPYIFGSVVVLGLGIYIATAAIDPARAGRIGSYDEDGIAFGGEQTNYQSSP